MKTPLLSMLFWFNNIACACTVAYGSAVAFAADWGTADAMWLLVLLFPAGASLLSGVAAWCRRVRHADFNAAWSCSAIGVLVYAALLLQSTSGLWGVLLGHCLANAILVFACRRPGAIARARARDAVLDGPRP